MVSAADRHKRVLVSLILALGRTYNFVSTVTRDSSDAAVKKAYHQASRRVHPDRGGHTADQQRLNGAYEAWCEVSRARGCQGRPSASAGLASPVSEAGSAETPAREPYKFRAQAVLLTYQSFSANLEEALQQWSRFVAWVSGSLRFWAVTLWTATLETNKDGRHHAHLMVQFSRQIHYAVTTFVFEGLLPNAGANDLLGEGWSKKRWQTSVDRGHFYCWADKRGTVRDSSGKQCLAGNYEPAWTGAACSYAVLGPWSEKLWKAYKLTNEVYHEYLHLCRDGSSVPPLADPASKPRVAPALPCLPPPASPPVAATAGRAQAAKQDNETNAMPWYTSSQTEPRSLRDLGRGEGIEGEGQSKESTTVRKPGRLPALSEGPSSGGLA